MTVLPFSRPHDRSAADRPKVVHAYRRHAPKKAACPRCGLPGRRKGFLHRTVRSLAYHAILLVHVTTAEYRARCACAATFRTQVDGIEPKARYDNRVREAVLDRLLDDRMSLQQIRHALQRDFFLDLSDGFLYDCLDWKVRQCDGAAYRRWAVAHFSGTLCVDEIHLGKHALLLATDPLHDFPVAFAVVSANDAEHMGRFLRQLRDHGLRPRVVVTDGSPLYPAVLPALWPQAAHQLCIFHVLKDLNRQVLEGVCRVRRVLRRQARRPGRRRRSPRGTFLPRGRPTSREKERFVFKHRHLIIRRRDRLTARQQQLLLTLLEYAPALRPFRDFMDEVHGLFERGQTAATAWRRRERLAANPAYQSVPELAAVLASLAAERFAKMIAFLRSPVGGRVRTNNHVERMNRVLRSYEKSRYKWRRSRTKVRFVCLLVDRWWGQPVPGGQQRPGAGTPRGSGSGATAETAPKSPDQSDSPAQDDHLKVA